MAWKGYFFLHGSCHLVIPTGGYFLYAGCSRSNAVRLNILHPVSGLFYREKKISGWDRCLTRSIAFEDRNSVSVRRSEKNKGGNNNHSTTPATVEPRNTSPMDSAAVAIPSEDLATVPLGEEEGEEKRDEDVLPVSSASASAVDTSGAVVAQKSPTPLLPDAANAAAMFDGTAVRLTRDHLTSLPHAVADGFWYTRDRVVEGSAAVLHQSSEMATSVRTWKCWTVSAMMTCSFYMCLAFTIPALILLATLLALRKHNKGGGEPLLHNGTSLRYY